MSNELFGYARVSTFDQNLDRQIDELVRYGIQEDHLYTDKFTGATLARPAFETMNQRLREGDVVITESLSRLSRTTKDLLSVIEDWQHRGITYISLKESIDFSTSTGKLILTVMASISEFERNIMKERVKEGITAARARGRYGGRKPTDSGKVAKAMKLYDARTHSLAEIKDITGVSQSVLYRALRKRNLTE
ncbi:DNA invertase Pin-like site-specific DNA recombinase [Alicyclobacillus sacchari]|uniref:DNA invertase Pin-like site-specific DNA recombinase n=1 Tax=Alicyclobacillus sacchari TaxID=392010 RepID=A0A4R8L896_9BACL|nr:recombinase family protein [Alicyclobacillus sacchari]TDY38992.1 DNA invertase Pin-like site-specific DNA recombinase [Alicyclobacillus sacchari]GMA58079.1 resolvase [Alicyclobacillus sacchari]